MAQCKKCKREVGCSCNLIGGLCSNCRSGRKKVKKDVFTKLNKS